MLFLQVPLSFIAIASKVSNFVYVFILQIQFALMHLQLHAMLILRSVSCFSSFRIVQWWGVSTGSLTDSNVNTKLSSESVTKVKLPSVNSNKGGIKSADLSAGEFTEKTNGMKKRTYVEVIEKNTSSRLKAATREFSVYAGNFDVNISKNDVKNYLCDQFPIVEVLVDNLPKRDSA